MSNVNYEKVGKTLTQPRSKAKILLNTLIKAGLATVSIGGAIYLSESAAERISKKDKATLDYIKAGGEIAGYAGLTFMGVASSFGAVSDALELSHQTAISIWVEDMEKKERKTVKKKVTKKATRKKATTKKKVAKKATTKKKVAKKATTKKAA